MSNVTVIDAKRGLRPRPAPDAEILAHLKALQDKVQGRDAHGLLEVALTGEFKGKTAVVSSFGAESAVLLKLVADIDPTTPILFLNTGKLFGETLRYRDRLQDILGLGDVRSISPSLEERTRHDAEGTLWSKNADACCDFRKTVPLNRALESFRGQITGRKRFQTRERSSMEAVEFHDGRYRFNPLWNWDLHQLEAFSERHKLPKHPLVEDGYPSIGCIPCTRRVQAGEDYRAGRWSGTDKDECGIHLTDGGGI
jgi:phosphoadenosine phosphosulfate reductase